MTTTNLLIKGVDHITIRVNDARYDHLFSLFADLLQLPLAWPVSERYPGSETGFKSGGIAAGSINMEIFRAGSRHPSQAQFYSIAFEPFSLAESLQQLAKRSIPHLPPLAIPQDTFGQMGTLWTLVFLGELFGGDLSLFPPITEGSSGKDILALRFDQVFRQGMAFLCAYNTAVYDIRQMKAKSRATLQAKHGGPLGLVDVQEIVIGAANFEEAQGQWQRLFTPLTPVSGSRWELSEGPALRLVPAAQDGVVALVWKVGSLAQAKAFLAEKHMLGQVLEQQITLAPPTMLGLDIRLVE